MDLHSRYLNWSERPPPELVSDPIWRLPAFRLGRFLSVVAAEDSEKMRTTVRDPTVAQLLRSIDSISANIAEGYSRFSGKDRARFYEIAAGSAREAREWYVRLNRTLGANVVQERTDMLNRIIRILNFAIPEERAGSSERRMTKQEKG